MTENPSPTPVADTKLIATLRVDFERAQWTTHTCVELMGQQAWDALLAEDRLPALLALRASDTVAAVLTRLFTLGVAQSSVDIDRALPGVGVDGLVTLGLIDEVNADLPSPSMLFPWGAPDGSEHEGLKWWKARFDLRPHRVVGGDGEEWWILSDQGQMVTGQALRIDHVMGIGGATRSLIRMLPPVSAPVPGPLQDDVVVATPEPNDPTAVAPAQRKLVMDLGTGCGIVALYLTRIAERVIATDLSQRACAITAFNAQLNGADIDIRCGSLFEPVEGEVGQIDLIVTNPPFVITPQALRGGGVAEYRDAGMERDQLLQLVIRGAAQTLAPGGQLLMLANWEHEAGADWDSHLRAWVKDLPLRTWAVERDSLAPAAYAQLWLRDEGAHLRGAAQMELERSQWADGLAEAGVESVGMGFIAARKTLAGQAPVLVAEQINEGVVPGGDYIDLALDSFDYLPTSQGSPTVAGRYVPIPSDTSEQYRELDDVFLAVPADVIDERHFMPGTHDPLIIRYTQGGGMRRVFNVTSPVAALLGACDGELSVGQIITAISVLMELNEDDLRGEIIPEIHRMMRSGMVLPTRSVYANGD